MTAAPQRRDRARELFDEALELAPGDRGAFLADACAGDAALRSELDSLLRLNDKAQSVLHDPIGAVNEAPGDRIGHYKLLQRIGEGGFGTVWMAEQEEPVRRKVALKVLKAGMDTTQVVARFEAERQALALMEHPNIAQVFDGGQTAKGRPYFVMELVRGVPITRYCDEAGLSLRERLELFIPVCQAVQHAHYKGVIHRDIKPTNVLVTLHDGQPVPKVIDFGIAKATQGRLTDRTMFTEFGQMLGTPEYMAPEQAELSGLDVDTRADVYSLGVLLYELLTGTRPFDLHTLLQSGYAEILRTIKEVEPPKPSTRVSSLGDQLPNVARHRRTHPRALAPLMSGDLDWIVMMTLEKERNRRYATAAALSEDVQRYLRSEPVHAGPPSRLYKLRKYLQRHRIGVAAGAAVAISLIGGTVASTLGYLAAHGQSEIARSAERLASTEKAAAVLARDEERRQRQVADERSVIARREARKSKEVIYLLVSVMRGNDPHSRKGPDYPVSGVLAELAASLGSRLQGEPEVEAELRRILGSSYLGLGMPEAAEPHLLRARELQSTLPDAGGFAAVVTLYAMAELLHDQCRYDASLSKLEEATVALSKDGSLAYDEGRYLETQDDALRELRRHIEGLRIDNFIHLRRLDEAESLQRQVLADTRQTVGDEHIDVAHALRMLAQVQKDRKELEEAEDLCRQAFAMGTKLLGPDDLEVAWSKVLLADILCGSGRSAEAESLCEEALTTARKTLGAEHQNLVRIQYRLAMHLKARGDLAGAEDLYRQALSRAKQSEFNNNVTYPLSVNFALLLFERKQYAEAEQLAREALAMRRMPEHPDVPTDTRYSLRMLAAQLFQRKQFAEAEQFLRQALALREESGARDDDTWGLELSLLAMTLSANGKRAEAESLLEEALATARKTLGDERIDLVAVKESLAKLRQERGDLAGAEDLYQQALSRAKRGGIRSSTVHRISLNLSEVLFLRKQYAEAEQMARDALTIRRESQPPDDPTGTRKSLTMIAMTLMPQAKLAEAERFLREALALREGSSARDDATWVSELSLLSTVCRRRGQVAEAEQLAREGLVLARQRSVGGQRLADVLLSLAEALADRAQWAEAEPLCLEALQEFGAAARGRFPSRHHLLVRILNGQGKWEAAEASARESLSLVQKAHGVDSLSASVMLASLARTLLMAGRPRDAEPVARECLAIRTARDASPWQRSLAMAHLGRSLAGQGRAAEAEPLLVEACTLMQPPADSIRYLREALIALVGLYEQQGQQETAAPWRAKLESLPPDKPGQPPSSYR